MITVKLYNSLDTLEKFLKEVHRKRATIVCGNPFHKDEIINYCKEKSLDIPEFMDLMDYAILDPLSKNNVAIYKLRYIFQHTQRVPGDLVLILNHPNLVAAYYEFEKGMQLTLI